MVDGADDVTRCGREFAGVLDDVRQAGADIAVAALEESGGVSVAINAAPSDFVLLTNPIRADPVEKFLLDHYAKGMLTDRAVELVELPRRELPQDSLILFRQCLDQRVATIFGRRSHLMRRSGSEGLRGCVWRIAFCPHFSFPCFDFFGAARTSATSSPRLS